MVEQRIDQQANREMNQEYRIGELAQLINPFQFSVLVPGVTCGASVNDHKGAGEHDGNRDATTKVDRQGNDGWQQDGTQQ
jgi:hypothetical protein